MQETYYPFIVNLFNYIKEYAPNAERILHLKNVVNHVTEILISSNLSFMEKPILIGGMAMEYYEMRKAGADIDLIITDNDYQTLARKYPDQRKDLYGDLEMVIRKFEIWRSIAHLDYNFLKKMLLRKKIF